MKRILCVILSVLMIIPVFCTGNTAFAATPFDDEDVITDVPSGPDNQPVNMVQTISETYEQIDSALTEQHEEESPKQPANTNSGSNGNVETQTLFNNTIGSDSKKTGSSSSEENNTEDNDVIPDDAFSGDFKEEKHKDGSVTKIYDNGSVVTTFNDGTKMGVAYSGHRVTEDKNGNQTGYYHNGDTVVIKNDGSTEYNFADGGKEVFTADGKHYSVSPYGYNIDYDENDNMTSVYFENGECINIIDENGNLVEGDQSISGPNGEKVSFSYKGGDPDNDEWLITKFYFSAEGNGISTTFDVHQTEDGGLTLDWNKGDSSLQMNSNADGTSVSMDYSANNGDFQMHSKQEGNQFSMNVQEGDDRTDYEITANENGGGTFEAKSSKGDHINIEYDKDGNPISADIKTDSATMIMNEDGSVSFNDEKNNSYLTTDENGEITSLSVTKDGSSYTFKDGTGVLTTDDGNKVMWTHDENGNLVIVSPNDGKYEVDPDGNLYYDGAPLRVNGIWVNVDSGYNPDESTTETTTEAPDLIEQICGTYEMSGTSVVDMKGARPKSESRDFTVNVSDAGDGNITVSVEDEKNSFTETAKLDEGNKSASFDTTVSTEYAAFTYNCKITFDTSGGDPSAELTILLGNKGSEDGYAEIIVSGAKS